MQFSNWRRTEITCNSTKTDNGTTQVDFLDTKPNMFIIHNRSNIPLQCSINRPVKSKRVGTSIEYRGDFSIKANDFSVIGFPTPATKLFFMNVAPSTADITIFSIYDKFDINILKNMNVEMSDVEVNSDGVINSFNCSLPQGDNKIGKVEVTNLPTTDNLVLSNYSGRYNFLYAENCIIESGDDSVIFDTIDVINNPTDYYCDIVIYFDVVSLYKLHLTLPPHSFLSNVTDIPVYEIILAWQKGDGYIEVIGKKKE